MNRQETIIVKVTADEKQRLQTMAGEVPLGRWIRSKLLAPAKVIAGGNTVVFDDDYEVVAYRPGERPGD